MECNRINGNSITDILEAFQIFKGEKNKPTAIIADTIAGKGVSFLEGTVKSHGKWITDEERIIAIKDLS